MPILLAPAHLPSDFHPVLRQWWQGRFAEPTEAQLEGWRAIRAGGDTLIAAPTGSGKTLAAFLTAIDDLLRESLQRGGLPDEVRVIYVSPLKALSADIHKNLAVPRREIQALSHVRITAAVRSGDTPQSERTAMLRTPPHVLVTTPESLYLLLTARRSRCICVRSHCGVSPVRKPARIGAKSTPRFFASAEISESGTSRFL